MTSVVFLTCSERTLLKFSLKVTFKIVVNTILTVTPCSPAQRCLVTKLHTLQQVQVVITNRYHTSAATTGQWSFQYQTLRSSFTLLSNKFPLMYLRFLLINGILFKYLFNFSYLNNGHLLPHSVLISLEIASAKNSKRQTQLFLFFAR